MRSLWRWLLTGDDYEPRGRAWATREVWKAPLPKEIQIKALTFKTRDDDRIERDHRAFVKLKARREVLPFRRQA